MRTVLTASYRNWIDSVENPVTRARIQVRVDRLAHGNPGKGRRLMGGVCELKMDFGPGYRVYYAERKGVLVLLCGGDKTTQAHDIHKALSLLEHL